MTNSKHEVGKIDLKPGLYLVATPIGNLGDVSLRALETLNSVDQIACEDTRVTKKLLKSFAIATRLTSYHEYNAKRNRPKLIAKMLDGSALAFVREILKAGIKLQRQSLKAIRILKTVKHKHGLAWAEFQPSKNPRMSFSIEFSDAAIGTQSKTLDMSNGSFVRELCDSRTFCRYSEVEAMRSKGFALGGSYENAVVVDGKNVLSPGGLRHSDEPVRHKMLDALGDIALAGYPIIGHYVGYRAGHGITHGLLRSLFAYEGNFEIISCDKETVENLPGSGVKLSEVCKVA